MSDKKKLVIKLIGLALLLVFVAFVYLYIKADSSRQGIDKDILGKEYGNKYFTMANDIPIETTFQSKSEVIKSVKLYFTYGTKTLNGSIDVSLIDVATGEVVRTVTVGCPAVSYVDYTEFYFAEPVTGALDKEFILRVTCHGVPDNQLNVLGREDEGENSLCMITTMPGSGAYARVLTIVFVLLGITIVGIYVYGLFGKEFKMHIAYLIIALGLGVIMNLCIPFRIAPDERTHCYKAYEISNSILGIDISEQGTLMMRYEDSAIFATSSELDYSFFDAYYNGFFQDTYNTDVIDSGVKPIDTQWYLFIFSGLGITIGRLAGLGATMSFVLGRWLNLLVFTLVTAYAIKKMPFGKGVVMVWSLLPIMLQQVGSYSYDSMINTLSVLVISLTLHFMYGEKETKKKYWGQLTTLIVAALLLVPCKSFALLPLALFPMAIVVKYLIDHRVNIKEKLDNNKKLKYICIGASAFVVVAVATVGFVVVKRVLGGATGNGHFIAWANEYAHPIGHYLKNPIDFVGHYIVTLWTSGGGYFLQMLGGYLGWLDIEVPVIFVIPFFILLLYAGMRRQGEDQLVTTPAKAWMWIVFVGVFFLASLGMLLFWTPMSRGSINGLQGRYFLPALILPIIALRSSKSEVRADADKIIAYSIPVIYIFIITTLLKFTLW